jgi:hypothetical protein
MQEGVAIMTGAMTADGKDAKKIAAEEETL